MESTHHFRRKSFHQLSACLPRGKAWGKGTKEVTIFTVFKVIKRNLPLIQNTSDLVRAISDEGNSREVGLVQELMGEGVSILDESDLCITFFLQDGKEDDGIGR